MGIGGAQGRDDIGFQEHSELWYGAAATFFAALLGGGAGFGYALMAAPLLLLIGFPPPFVVTTNFSLGLMTRIAVAYRFRYHINPRRVGTLLAGLVPGLIIGVIVLTRVDESLIKMTTGILVIVAATILVWSTTRPEKGRTIPGGTFIAAFIGGIIGTTTSLTGIPVAIYLIRERLEPIKFIADLAAFFVIGGLISITVLIIGGAFRSDALFPAAVLWLPGAMIGNLVGARIGAKLPPGVFRKFTLVVVFFAGIITIFTA